MMIAALTLAAALAVSPQDVQAPPEPDRIGDDGCGYRPDSGKLVPISYAVFYDDDLAPAFADENGYVYRTADGWGPLSDTPFTGARGRAWFEEPTLTWNGVAYKKHGFPRVYGHGELAYRAEHDGVGVFESTEPPIHGDDVIFVLVDPADCAFQPYSAE